MARWNPGPQGSHKTNQILTDLYLYVKQDQQNYKKGHFNDINWPDQVCLKLGHFKGGNTSLRDDNTQDRTGPERSVSKLRNTHSGHELEM
jgi:hypothetical protein